ncbi:hypothetical protein GCM10022227_03220 [Streptomyces sedi]
MCGSALPVGSSEEAVYLSAITLTVCVGGWWNGGAEKWGGWRGEHGGTGRKTGGRRESAVRPGAFRGETGQSRWDSRGRHPPQERPRLSAGRGPLTGPVRHFLQRLGTAFRYRADTAGCAMDGTAGDA